MAEELLALLMVGGIWDGGAEKRKGGEVLFAGGLDRESATGSRRVSRSSVSTLVDSS